MRGPVVATSIDRNGPGFFSRMADSELWLSRLMLAPAILYILLLVGFPFFLSLFYSVSNATVGSTNISFTGLENFQRVIESDTFWVALKNTSFSRSSPSFWSWCLPICWRWRSWPTSEANGSYVS